MNTRWLGSWIAGPQAAAPADGYADTGADAGADGFPGARLGLPAAGPGAIASLGRRAGQLLLDVVLSWLVADLVAAHSVNGVRTPYAWSSVAVYVGQCALFVLLGGQTAGMRLTGLRVVRADGGRVGVGAAVLRPLLTLLLVPLFFPDRDLRPVHDRMTGTVVVRTG